MGDDVDDHRDDSQLPGWVMPALTGAGTLLAAALLFSLRRRRANQHRMRRPGHTLTNPEPDVAAVEMSVTVAGRTATSTVELLDQVLRRLATTLVADQRPLPALAAVEVTATAIALHLRDAAEPPPTSPFAVAEDRLLWVVDAEISLDDLGPDPGDGPAPWPLLVTIGHDERDAVWLLNLEDLNVTVSGDPVACTDFARFVAAEIACNPWSRHTALDVVGVAAEIAPISPERITVHPTPTRPAADAISEAVTTVDRLAEHHTDTSTARAQQRDPDPWPSRLLIVDHEERPDALTQLIGLIADHPRHTATAVVLTGDGTAEGLPIQIDADRRLTIASVNLTATAVGLSTDEAHGCTALLAQADTSTDSIVPDLEGDAAWQSLATATGSLRDQYRISRQAQTITASRSLLEEPDAAYTAVATTTADDLTELAPKVTDDVRERAVAADPDLDRDLDDWSSPTCIRPRLHLLGPVGARTSGTALDRRKPYYTELFAYLTTRPHGATPDEVADAFDITTSRVRTDVNKLRSWLGANEAGERFVPDARTAPAAQARGVGVYQVVDALVDVDLFRRLRVRGETRGPDGINDLVRALQLVDGRPFDKLRPGGWGWLLEGDRLDQHMVCAIVDVAHVVIAHKLHTDDLEGARTAASIAMLAAPDEEIPRLDLAAVLDAQGHTAEAERIVRQDICNRSDDGEAPTELPTRSQQIIQAREWLDKKAI